jgi:hypothetical protein
MTKKEELMVKSYLLEEDDYKMTLTTLEHTSWGKHEYGEKWAILRNSDCLNKKGEWEYSPSPSNRDADFLTRCRWDSVEEALAFWDRCKSSHKQDGE